MPQRPASDESPLLIDRAAAAEVPTADAVREWAGDKRVFISSVMAELAEERQAAAEAIRSVGARPVLFEDFGGRDADPEEAYLAEVESSDIYLGIIGRRYGKLLKTRFSATHTEYSRAERNGLRIAVWALATDDREGHEQSFLDEIRTFHVAPVFQTAADLHRQVTDRLKGIAAEDLAPWCKLGTIVFRAMEIADRGSKIAVRGRVRNDEVAHALEQLRPDRWDHGGEKRFTWQGRSKHVRVRNVATTSTSARSRLIQLDLDVVEASRDNLLEVSIGGMSPDDLTETGLRTALFGEQSPNRHEYMGFFPEIPDPFAPLREHPVSEEALRPIAEVLLADVLVGTGRAERLVSVRLGVRVNGQRKLELAWQTPRRYTSQRGNVRSINGVVDL
jgi:hypothetical protein